MLTGVLHSHKVNQVIIIDASLTHHTTGQQHPAVSQTAIMAIIAVPPSPEQQSGTCNKYQQLSNNIDDNMTHSPNMSQSYHAAHKHALRKNQHKSSKLFCAKYVVLVALVIQIVENKY